MTLIQIKAGLGFFQHFNDARTSIVKWLLFHLSTSCHPLLWTRGVAGRGTGTVTILVSDCGRPSSIATHTSNTSSHDHCDGRRRLENYWERIR